MSDLWRIQRTAFDALDDSARLRLAARRTLQALDRYWAVYERDADLERLWWDTFERWRARLEDAIRAGPPRPLAPARLSRPNGAP